MTDQKPADTAERRIRSFVIRQGHFTESQRRALENHWPHFGCDLGDGPLSVAERFPQCERTVLEIGFGMGYTLAELALREPATAYIGVEVHKPGVGKLLALAVEHELSNLCVYCDDAIDVLNSAIAPDSLDAVLLFFPDPWHKKRHNKRRIVQPAFAQAVRDKLKIGGLFHMATDWGPYAEHMMTVMETAEGFSNVAGPGHFTARPASRPETRFEQRGKRLGHDVWDLIYQRIN